MHTVIVDDAESLLEPEFLIVLDSLRPKQVLLIGSDDAPRPLVHSWEQSKVTHFNKSLFTRMLDREWKAIEVKSTVRFGHRLKEVYTKVFDEALFTLEAPS